MFKTKNLYMAKAKAENPLYKRNPAAGTHKLPAFVFQLPLFWMFLSAQFTDMPASVSKIIIDTCRSILS